MKDGASYVCDSCGEEIVVPIDVSAGSEQEYVEDLVLAGQLGFELLDLLLLGVLGGLALAAIVEGSVPVLEELLEPGMDLVRIEVELIAQIGDGDLLEQMPFSRMATFSAPEK
jgi:hypothetical protein